MRKSSTSWRPRVDSGSQGSRWNSSSTADRSLENVVVDSFASAYVLPPRSRKEITGEVGACPGVTAEIVLFLWQHIRSLGLPRQGWRPTRRRAATNPERGGDQPREKASRERHVSRSIKLLASRSSTLGARALSLRKETAPIARPLAIRGCPKLCALRRQAQYTRYTV